MSKRTSPSPVGRPPPVKISAAQISIRDVNLLGNMQPKAKILRAYSRSFMGNILGTLRCNTLSRAVSG